MRKGALTPALIGCLAAASCQDFDSTRTVPVRGTLGTEMFGVVCDRVGAQSLHEDLTGASYRDVCHPGVDGMTFATDSVDTTRLPPLLDGQADAHGNAVPLAKQESDRAYGVARVHALALHRADLVDALDATFPDVLVSVVDAANPLPSRSCTQLPTRGSLHTELSNLLSRFQNLYDDGTIPRVTEALARGVDAFRSAKDAQTAWARFDARAGYRPIDIALGAARPIIAYPHLRDFTNATLKLISPDSNPYDPKPAVDAQGNRVPTPGPAYPQLTQLIAVAHAELANAASDPPPTPLVLSSIGDASVGNRPVLNRPRTDLEFLQALLYDQDPSFGSGPSHYIVLRDPRGYAQVPLVNGAVPGPFVDANHDGLPDVNDLGQLLTQGGRPAPSPFFAIGAPAAPAHDASGRALGLGGQPLYAYLDTSRTLTATLLGHLRGSISGKSLVDPNIADNHETLMYALAGTYVLFGTRDGSPATTRSYPDRTVLPYDAFHTDASPLVDLVYAMGQILADSTADATLALTSTLMSQNTGDVARVIGDALYAKGLSNADTLARVPPTSTLWDELIDLLVQIEQDTSVTGGHRLLEDLLTALGDDASLGLSKVFSSQMANLDRISYDRNNLNGPAFDFTTSTGSAPKTPVDRSQPDTGANRSELQRFVQTVHDSSGVTACNKENAILHANLGGLPVDICNGTTGGDVGALCNQPGCSCLGQRTFHECEVFKIDDLAKFYIDAMVGSATLYFRPNFARSASNVGIIEQSSGIGFHTMNPTANNPAADDTYNGPDVTLPGFWDTVSSKTIRPKPGWLNRLIFFDLANDSPTQTGTNYATNHFLADLQGSQIGTAVCPERPIADPCNNDTNCGATNAAAGVAPDGKVHGLRSCQDGDWIFQRDQDATFVTEENGFFQAVKPLTTAFVNHGREDLFIGLLEILHKHWQTAAAASASPDECKLATDSSGATTSCSGDGADTYEPLVSSIFGSDILPALHGLTRIVGGLTVPTCGAIDPSKHICTQPGMTDGIGVLAAAVRALVDPDHAKALKLTDRRGSVTSPRNDGTTNPQVTPLYLVLDTLSAMDTAFVQHAGTSPRDPDKNRLSEWRLARSQLVDEILSVNGQNTATQTFADPSLPKIAPVLIDTLRAQLLARCGSDETTGSCKWARHDLWSEMSVTVGGPTFAGTMDLLEAIRRDPSARTEQEKLLSYLVDPKSVDTQATTELLSSSDDLLQVLRDDTNLVPLYHVLAGALATSPASGSGTAQRSVVDAVTTLLLRTAGRVYDASHGEVCSSELDPNGVLNIALAQLVTPLTPKPSAGCQPTTTNPCPGETPLEVIIDTIADVSRASPGAKDKLQGADYANMSSELSEFLLDGQRGLEQFYEIVRQGTQ